MRVRLPTGGLPVAQAYAIDYESTTSGSCSARAMKPHLHNLDAGYGYSADGGITYRSRPTFSFRHA
jgi:hypothetical protein